MTRKLAILFAVLALSYIANATADSNSPASVFAVTPGKLFTNGTDTAFTSLKGDCYFTGGFDNTTNYVWCQTASASSTVPYTYQRRAINASSPATTNSTADTKLASAHYSATNGMTTCSGAGYFGLATGYGTGTSPAYKSDVSFSFAAVNASSFTKVALTSNSDANMINEAQVCFYDNGIFYIIYTSYNYCQSGSESGCSAANLTQNAVYIQGVNVTSGAVYYNSTGGVKLLSPTTQTMSSYSGSTLSFTNLVGNNQTGYATQGLLLYQDSSSSTAGATKYNMLPITLSTGAAGSVQTLATGALTSASATGVTYTTTSTVTSTTSTSTGSVTSYLTSTVFSYGASSTEITLTTTSSMSTATYVSDGTTSTQYTVLTSGTNTLSSITASSTTVLSSTLFTYYTSLSLSTTTSVGTLTSTQTTTYGMSAFGSLSTYGVVLTQTIRQSLAQQSSNDYTKTYANSLFINGSSTATTTANLTNPSGYYLAGVSGFATTDGGFCLIEYFPSTTSGSAAAVYKDTYYYNGTQTTTSVSLGTYESTPKPFADATGSIWLGYVVNDDSNGTLPLVSAYAGEVLYQNLSASTLSSIFATLAIMIAALFAF